MEEMRIEVVETIGIVDHGTEENKAIILEEDRMRIVEDTIIRVNGKVGYGMTENGHVLTVILKSGKVVKTTRENVEKCKMSRQWHAFRQWYTMEK